MKSFFSGVSAKLALAVLAAGAMFTSCYDSENGDVTVKLPQPAKYVISGNITDGATGDAITTATVTIDGAAVDATKGYIYAESSVGDHTVAVSAPGYKDVQRVIKFGVATDGSTVIGNADFVLYVADAEIVAPDATGEATPAATEALFNDIKEKLSNDFLASLGSKAQDLLSGSDEKGTYVSAAVIMKAEEGEDLTVTVPQYTGFESSIPMIDTKAATEGQMWNASASAFLGLPYGITVSDSMWTVTLKGVTGKAITGYRYTVWFDSKSLTFNAIEGTVLYPGSAVCVPIYDSHDSHDIHNIHGNGNGAGGGASMQY